MSDTPRTDREVYKITERDIGFEAVGATLCRTIERELAQAVNSFGETVTRAERAEAMHAEAFRIAIHHQDDARAVRELMNIHNLGGWTDALGPMKRALAAEAERDTWKEAAEARAGAEEKLRDVRAYAELLRFAASEALIAIESDPDIERGWPNTVALLREALAKNREGAREAALQALTDFHQEHAPSGQWVPETSRECRCEPMGPYDEMCPVHGRDAYELRHQSWREPADMAGLHAAFAAWSERNPVPDRLADFAAGAGWRSVHQVFRKEGDRIVVAPGALREWPHIAAILAGTVAGDFRDWPKVRAELLDFIRVHQCGDSQFVACTKQEGGDA